MFQSWIGLVGSDWMFQKLQKPRKILSFHIPQMWGVFYFQNWNVFLPVLFRFRIILFYLFFNLWWFIFFQEKCIIWCFFSLNLCGWGLLSGNRTCHQLTGTVVRLEIWSQSLKGYKQRLKASPAQKCQYGCQHISKQLTKPRQTFLSVWQD